MFKVPFLGLSGGTRDISSSGASNPGLEDTFSEKRGTKCLGTSNSGKTWEWFHSGAHGLADFVYT